MSSKQFAAQRTRMANRQGWKCYFCCIPMTPVTPGRPKPTQVTFEHMHSRYDPERGVHKGKYINVASCWKCNNDRAIAEDKATPAEIKIERAKRHRTKAAGHPESPST